MFQLISPSSYFTDDLLEVVCRNRGVDINLIKNPSADNVIDAYKLEKMVKAVHIFKQYYSFTIGEHKINLGIIVDSDCDGITSAGALYRYIEEHFPEFNLFYYIHPGKEHGITKEAINWVKENDIGLLIVPDAGSSDFESHKILRELNVMTICLDHHETPRDSTDAIVVNSQLSPEYSNKELSGVGITYKFLKCLDKEFGFEDADFYLDLVSLGNIGDSMDITEPETRYYVYEGIANLQNEVLKELIFQNIGQWSKVNPNSLAFDVIPKINGMIRAGTMEEKYELFEAMVGHGLDEIHENPKARTEKNKQETFLKKAVRQAKNAHSRQNTAKKKWIKKIKEQVVENNAENNIVIIAKFKKKDKFDGNLTGVIAGSLTSYYKRPVIILHEASNGTTLTGSMRGYDGFTKETKSLLEATGLFNWVQGHENAAGCSIEWDNLMKLEERLQETIKTFALAEVAIGATPVDFILDAGKFAGHIVEEVDKYSKYWSKGLEAPTFAITNVTADFEDVKITDNGMMSFELNGVSYKQFSADKEFIDLKGTTTFVTMDVIGTMGINEYMGKITKQFIIDEFIIKKKEDNSKTKYKFLF